MPPTSSDSGSGSSRRSYSHAAAHLLLLSGMSLPAATAANAFRRSVNFGIGRGNSSRRGGAVSSAAFANFQHRRSATTETGPRSFAPHGGRSRSSLLVRPPTSALYSSTVSKEDSTTPTTTSENVDSQYDLSNASSGLSGTSYEPSSFESSVYQWWEDAGCFLPDAKQSAATSKAGGKEPYVLPMPPPNVTGRLHMGHAIFVALQDVLARFHRMRGRPVLWTPGTDHAGIATQLQVEKLLASEGKRRGTDEEIALAADDDDEKAKLVGREEFLERVWEYKEEQGGAITFQLRSLGASADWTRERFTMDPALSVGVSEAFCRLHEKGLVYRGTYMVNWSPGLMTAVSDLEVEYTEEEGKLYYFKYLVESDDEEGEPAADGEEYLAVATTRPETIFGDTAVCVNPEDDRYAHLVGKRALVPMSDSDGGKMRSIPIIADDYVDMEFGTGALKITPGHDPNDYEIGKKHSLEIMNVMNKDATMNSNAGARYEGLDRFEARGKLWEDMEEKGFVIKVEPHMQRVPRSQRGGEVIEPLVSKQWFVKTEGMGAKALEAVKGGDIQIVPQRFEKVWYGWLTDIRDWCISRQLWWGHRIPVWYVGTDSEEEYIVARNEEEARTKAVEAGHPADVVLRQEDDVLDTWFSSGLWPFATVGWPQDENADDPNSDLARFYPGTCLETGYDILFFWVARMVMLGIELTGVSPFQVIYLHGLVRAADNTKMSKTKGNVVDPLDTVGEYGADSLRYSLVTGVTPGQDIPLNMEKIAANKAFANKLWNCCKFVTDNALKDAGEEELASLGVTGPMGKEEFENLALPERYIISKCHELVASVTSDIEKYQLGAAGSKIYEFLWDQYADWYIEISKTRLYEGFGGGGDDAKTARRVLVYILDTSMRLLHPYMPYVTEQLWHHLPRAPKTDDMAANALMLADWPQMDDNAPLVTDKDAIATFEVFQALTRSIRNARAEYNVEQGKKISATIVASGHLKEAIEAEVKSLVMLAKLDPEQVAVVESGSEEAKEVSAGDSAQLVVQDGVEAYLPLSGLIDVEKEKARLEKQSTKLAKEIEKLAGRLQSKGFVDKAPPAVVDKARAELAELEDQASKVQSSLETL
eukprot:CAMPEP_0196146536 /NCGR_PEP_ID=MMETSP0910-20130528/23250_1 /TAXON_ID=49265 /ORGANISM="Thalassiosira rotula, Strain GSO102" /LENGTH=1100 /DNA_ID=CAMNT_0041408749 /DNA_START=146 /DNA_END=3448 /DNA_ORIENTATION=-